MIEGEAYQLRHRCFIAYHLRHIEESRLQRCRAARHESRLAICQERISLVFHQFDRRTHNKLLVILILYGRSTSQHHLIVLKSLRHLYHRRQIVFDFLQTTTSQQGDDWLMNVKIILLAELSIALMISSSKLIYFLGSRITHIVDRIVMLLLIERHFERQDREHLGDVSLDAPDAPLLPSPNLRGYIVISRYQRILFQELSDTEVESRIIHQYHDIRFPIDNILFTHLHIGEDGTQMQENGHKTHIGKFLVMLDTRTSFGSHQVATEEAKLRQFVHFFQRAHQPTGMKVATRLAYYQIILHNYRWSYKLGDWNFSKKS